MSLIDKLDEQKTRPKKEEAKARDQLAHQKEDVRFILDDNDINEKSIIVFYIIHIDDYL